MAHRTPSYRLHRPTGQAVVTIAGRDIYLGKHGSDASRAEYDRIIAEWLAGGRGRAAPGVRDMAVSELILAYLEFAEGHYRATDGAPTCEVDCIRDAVKPLRRLYGHTEAARFGPLALKAVRQSLIDARLCRTTINARVGRIKRLFKWAVENELVPPSVHHALSAVAGLRAGRSEAREPRRVEPVPDAHVEAVLPLLTEPVRAMVRLQALCGARSGEITRIRPCDVDRSGAIWIYRPSRHKTMHRGRGRAIPLGPRCQAILGPWLDGDPEAFVFTPAAAVERRNAERRKNRKTKVQPSQASRKREAKPLRERRPRYDSAAYLKAVTAACDRAGVPRWGPHRLRHAVATKVRAAYGLEAAQTLLGHAKANTTEIYAERDLAKALAVMAEIG